MSNPVIATEAISKVFGNKTAVHDLSLAVQTGSVYAFLGPNGAGKSLLSLPAPRWTLYVSKLVITITLLWAAHAVLVVGTIGSGMLLKLFYPGLNLGSMPLDPFVVPMLRVSASALLAVAIQHWVSLRWQSYSVAIGFGMCAMLAGIFAVQSKTLGAWFPWSLPIRAVLDGAAGQDRITAVTVVGAILATTLGCWGFVRREIG